MANFTLLDVTRKVSGYGGGNRKADDNRTSYITSATIIWTSPKHEGTPVYRFDPQTMQYLIVTYEIVRGTPRYRMYIELKERKNKHQIARLIARDEWKQVTVERRTGSQDRNIMAVVGPPKQPNSPWTHGTPKRRKEYTRHSDQPTITFKPK